MRLQQANAVKSRVSLSMLRPKVKPIALKTPIVITEEPYFSTNREETC